MNKLRLCAVVIAVAMPAFTVSAEEAHHPDKEGAAPAESRPGGAMGQGTEPLQEQMEKMRAQMQSIHETKQPKERQKLLREHMQSMRAAMKMMRGMTRDETSRMGGTGMMMDGMMGGGMMDMMMGGMGGRGGMSMMDMMGGMGALRGLDLSEEQRAKLHKIEDEQRKKTWGLTGKIMDESAKLRELYGADAPDANKIGAVYDRIFDLKRELIVTGIEARNKARALLTPEQQKQLKQQRRGGMSMMGGDGVMQRLEMMEQMLEQMLEHQAAAQGGK